MKSFEIVQGYTAASFDSFLYRQTTKNNESVITPRLSISLKRGVIFFVLSFGLAVI